MELLLAIAILAIVTTAALPAFTTFIQNNRLTGQTNELVTAFQFARSEALKRADPVTVCSSSDGEDCGGSWNEGWMVIANRGAGDDEDPAGGSVEFEANGFATAALNIELDLENCTADNARRVLIERTGRVGSERFDCT